VLVAAWCCRPGQLDIEIQPMSPSSSLALLHLVELGYLVQQLARLLRVCNPRCSTGQASLEVVGPSTQELVANVQRLPALDASENALAS
jgi:hypothetical protein